MSVNPSSNRPTIVVIGNGMVGHRFCERMVELDTNRKFQIVTFCEEPRAAYDRVGLTQFFAHQDAQKLAIANLEWYRENDIAIYLNERASKIDRDKRIVVSNKGTEIHYDYIVLATGSYPFVPEVPGIKNEGVFVYRTIEDLEKIIAYGKQSKRAAVIGGGLLGLEAAKAAYDLNLETHVIEFAPRLMPRQVDDRGSQLLVSKIKELGVQVHLNKGTKEVLGKGTVTGLRFNDDSELDVDMVIVSAGIRPRDELAKQAELRVGDRGGVVVDDCLRTSDYDIFAIGEVALHGGMIYGLVAPGYEMADVVANVLCGNSKTFNGTDLSAKLKLMGVDVASFGDAFADQHIAHPARALAMDDPFAGVYKKLLVSADGTRLVGGILVGDASEYGSLLARFKSSEPLSISPSDLLFGSRTGAAASSNDLPNDAQVCSCNNVTRAQLCDAIRGQELITIDEV
jgi:NAD(P)H-dependent nitrite reductase large subunit